MRIEFLIPENLGLEDLLASLQKNARIVSEPLQTIHRTYYDSFDWRLYHDDSLLEDTRDGKAHILVWRGLKGENRCPRLQLDKAPGFARDLPQGPFRKRLEPLLEMRELAPQVRIRSRIHTLRILNKDEKTVARLSIEENTLPRQQGKRALKLGHRAVLIPVRGYHKPGKEVAKLLQAQGLTPAEDDLMLEARQGNGKTPAGAGPDPGRG